MSIAVETIDPSASLEPLPSKAQSVPSQVDVTTAAGAWFGSTVRRTTAHDVAVPLGASAVATRPP